MVLRERIDNINAQKQQLAETERNKRIDERNKLVTLKLNLVKETEKFQNRILEMEQLKQTRKLWFFERWQIHSLKSKLKRAKENIVRLHQQIESLR